MARSIAQHRLGFSFEPLLFSVRLDKAVPPKANPHPLQGDRDVAAALENTGPSLDQHLRALFKCCTVAAITVSPQWRAADAEIKVPSGVNTELKCSPFISLE